MKVLISDNPDYKSWLIELKSKIYSVQLKAAVTINSQLLTFYWDLAHIAAFQPSTVKICLFLKIFRADIP